METTDLIQLLLDCLQKDMTVDGARLTNLSTESWQSLLALAATQRVRPLLWHRLKQKGLDDAAPSNVAEELRNAFRRNTMHNLSFYGELRGLLSVLKSAGIPLILLKGIYLANTVYESIGLREMSDIDVLARPGDLKRIADFLVGMGYASPQPICPDTTIKSCHHLPPMIKKGHAGFEIHWNLQGPDVNGYAPPDSLWERAMPVHTSVGDALALSPEDLLLHLCLHTSYHHQFAFGLRPFCDIAATISHFGSALDWQTMTGRAIRRGWQRGVYLTLRLARELTGADVPACFLERLRPVDMTETVVEAARAQVFTDKGSACSITVFFAELLENRSVFDKCRIFWQRVFVPKTYIASLYTVPVDSMRIYGYYPYRVFDLARRYGRTLKKYQQNDAPLKVIVERTNLISSWLAGPVMLLRK